MKIEPAMNRYCRSLSRSASDALHDGLEPAEVFQGLLGTIAVSVRQSGGDDRDVAATFRTLADCYEGDGQNAFTANEYQQINRDTKTVTFDHE